MTEDLLNDKPNATAAEVALVRNLALAQVALGLCLAEVGTEGAFHVNADGQRVASAGLREVGKFMSEVRQGLVALGLDRRAAPTTTLDAYLSALKSGAATSVDAIPVEAVTVGESKS